MIYYNHLVKRRKYGGLTVSANAIERNNQRLKVNKAVREARQSTYKWRNVKLRRRSVATRPDRSGGQRQRRTIARQPKTLSRGGGGRGGGREMPAARHHRNGAG